MFSLIGVTFFPCMFTSSFVRKKMDTKPLPNLGKKLKSDFPTLSFF